MTATRARRASSHRRASRRPEQPTLVVPLRPDANADLHGRASPPRRCACPGHGRPTAASAPTTTRFDYTPVRIAFDVSPLSHERTGVNNYIRGSLAGLAEAARAARRTRSSRSRRPRRRGKRVIPEALDGHRRRAAARHAAGRARLAHRVVDRSATRRPSAGSARFDVLHFTDWMYPPQRARRARDDDPRPRAAAPPGVDDEAHALRCTAASTATPRSPATSCSPTPRSPPTTSPRRSASRASASLVAHPGIGAGVHGDRARRPTSAAPYVLTVATLEPRKNLGTLVDAFALLADTGLSLVVVGGEGWGEQPELDRPGVVRLGRVARRRARAPLPRRGGRRLPVALRGLRHADHRGDGLGRAGRRVRAPVDGRGRRATRRCAPTPRARRRSPPRSARRSRAATSCAQPGLAHARRFSWRRAARSSSRGTSDSRSARHDAAPPDARRHRALRARAARPPRRRSRCRIPATLARCARSSRTSLWYPRLRGRRRRRAALPDLPRAVPARHSRSSSPCTTSRCCGIPSGSTAGRDLLAPRRAARRARRRSRVIAVSEFTKRELVALLDVDRGEDPRRAERGRGRLHARRPARRGRLRARGRHARAAQEPRADRRGGRRRAARRRRARLGRRRAAARTSPGSARSTTRSSPRSTAARAASSTRRSTRASASRSPRRSRAAARS